MTFLTPAELRHTLKISRSTEHRLLKSGMPHVNSGRMKRYDETEVIKWFRQYSHQPNTTSNMLEAGDYLCGQCRFEGTLHEATDRSKIRACPRCGATKAPVRVR